MVAPVAVALTIPGTASPSFTITAATAALTVTPGGSTADTVTVAGAGGFAGSVTLGISGLPTGVTASFGTNPTRPAFRCRYS